jgi:hypothetical protein
MRLAGLALLVEPKSPTWVVAASAAFLEAVINSQISENVLDAVADST